MCFLGRFDIFLLRYFEKEIEYIYASTIEEAYPNYPKLQYFFRKVCRTYIQLPAFQQDSGSSRMLLHPQVKTTYLLSTAAVAGFLAREDGKSTILKKIGFAFSAALALKMLNQFLGNYKRLGNKAKH